MSRRHPDSADIIVAGHICLDIIPAMNGGKRGQGIAELFVPGKLIDVGAARLSTGGAVPNTGIALHRLGSNVKLMGKVGDDPFGQAILSILRNYGEDLAEGMIVAAGESSSYSIVISPPGVDRIFLHCTGANDTFSSEEVTADAYAGAKLFHFGYPPLMQRMYEEQGAELERLLAGAKAAGLTVSLDMARPDPDSMAGKADWRAILQRVLPCVDVFLPSFEEILYMLRPELYKELSERYKTSELLPFADGDTLAALSAELLDMGVAVAAIKLGEYGLYVRTSASLQRLRSMGRSTPLDEELEAWRNKELHVPCYKVDMAGTTGAGDCTIAGFLSGLARGLSIEDTLLTAVGVGACNVEQPDAVSGIPDWDVVRQRIASGWEQREVVMQLPGWDHDRQRGVWRRKGEG
ncbi:PfkB family carbohydrate kinase [Paenibacillus sp. J5C_2022]|uniref:carbohydrate kinase family protein n=1 Tax=Paenibacillus sp. J5C2022 TaxID=2977129 RepID=UPI0021D3A059|nr:PfkB family carbohydrate kinase [Paenibacillus sp. J5C2022]MCU6708427.1 PfkB family carbohydrate kinase [Paenibacillus sp. J5C2022]